MADEDRAGKKFDPKKDYVYKWWRERIEGEKERKQKEREKEENPEWTEYLLERLGYKPKDYEFGDTILSCVAKEFREKYGLGPNGEPIPPVRILPQLGAAGGWHRKERAIFLEKPVNFHDEKLPPGHLFGEEYSHFLRDYYCPPSSDSESRNLRRKQVNEFFGMLGRRLLYQTEIPRVVLGKVGPEGELVKSSKDELKKKHRRITGELLYLATSGRENDEEVIKRASKLLDASKDMRAHYFPYKYALNVDLSRIKDWEALYRMPDKEVRRRFFRKNPDYSGLDGTPVESSANLEKRVSVAAAILIGFLFLPFFLAGTITGHSIIENTKSFYFIVFPIILIVLSALFFIYLRNKN